MTGVLNDLFNFYIEQRGWLIFVIVPAVVFIGVLIDNQNHSRGGIGWLVAIFICLLLFVPAAIYDLGSQETRLNLNESRQVIFIVGMLGTVVPIFLAIGYWLSSQVGPAPSAEAHEEVNFGGQGLPPDIPNSVGGQVDDEAETAIGGPPGQSYTPPEPPAEAFDNPPPSFAAPDVDLANAWLIDVKDPQQRYQLKKGNNSIGRGGKHDVNLPDEAVSRSGHVLVQYKKGAFIIRDTGSSNGTLLNGYNLDQDQQLVTGDRIIIGDTELELVIG